MTVVVVILAPPREALSELVETTPLSGEEAANLYRAMARDTCRAVAESGGDLLVNYPAPEDHPDGEALAREVLAGVDVADPRLEVQVGSTFAARAGNAVTHLLDGEEARSVAVVDGRAPLLDRTTVDSAAMKLRTADVVLGPDGGGDVYFAGFCEPVDFAEAYTPPAVETLARRAAAADCSVDFLPQMSAVRTRGDLRAVLAALGARRVADRAVPTATAAALDEAGVTATDLAGTDSS